MMDFFFWFKVAAKFFFHYQAMFTDFVKSVSERMIVAFDKAIASTNSSMAFLLHFLGMTDVFAIKTTKPATVIFKFPRFYFKGLTTGFAYFGSVFHILPL
jgi:hypothetical protein